MEMEFRRAETRAQVTRPGAAGSAAGDKRECANRAICPHGPRFSGQRQECGFAKEWLVEPSGIELMVRLVFVSHLGMQLGQPKPTSSTFVSLVVV